MKRCWQSTNAAGAARSSPYSDPGFDSVFSGNTTDICPVGALTTVDFRFGARPWECKSSLFSLCAVPCGLQYHLQHPPRSQSGRQSGHQARHAAPERTGQRDCGFAIKAALPIILPRASRRLEKPLVRGQAVSWEDALNEVSSKFAEAKSDTVVLASGRLSNEDLFNLKSFADGLGGKAVLYTDMGGGDLVMQVGVGQGTNFSDLGNPLRDTRRCHPGGCI
jgi:NADH-quinone oxidoreductase subunit G